jgi:HEAT repeat protein
MKTMKPNTRRLRLIGLAVGIPILFLAMVVFLIPKEPHYDGRPISAWIEDLTGPVNPQYGAVGSEALPKLIQQAPGGEIVPALRATLRRGRSLFDTLYIKIHPHFPEILAKKFEAPNPVRDGQLRYRAALILYYIGPEARGAASELIGALQDPNPEVRRVAANTLGHFAGDPKVIRTLKGGLEDSNPSVRRAALASLSAVQEESRITEFAARLLEDSDAGVRRDAAQLLKNLGSAATPAIPSLVNALRDENDDVLRFAAQALGRIGPKARQALPALLEVLQENRPYTETTIRWALRKIDPEALEQIASEPGLTY